MYVPGILNLHIMLFVADTVHALKTIPPCSNRCRTWGLSTQIPPVLCSQSQLLHLPPCASYSIRRLATNQSGSTAVEPHGIARLQSPRTWWRGGRLLGSQTLCSCHQVVGKFGFLFFSSSSYTAVSHFCDDVVRDYFNTTLIFEWNSLFTAFTFFVTYFRFGIIVGPTYKAEMA